LSERDRINPQTAYAVSKAASEFLAAEMCRMYPIDFVGLRLSNVLYEDPNHHASYSLIPGYWKDLAFRKFNLWGYIDSRDAARAVRLALESPTTGSENFNIAARDTIMKQTNQVLVDAVFPDCKLPSDALPRVAFLDCSKARSMLGFEPEYVWADVIGPAE